MSQNRTMQVARIHRQGGPETLKLETVPVPTPGQGQVLIRVESASVNFSDVKRRRGDMYPFATPLPFVPGGEVAGTIAAVGPGVTELAPDMPVFGLVGGDGQGGYAQYAVAVAAQVNPRPPALDADRASALIVAGGTAMLLVKTVAGLQAGETILIPAASGSVGSYAVQIAKRVGAKVVAAAGSQPRADAALALGADIAIDYSRSDWAAEVHRATGGQGVDVLLEASGGLMLAQGLEALAPFGRAVVYGAASGRSAALDTHAIERFFYAPAQNQSLIAFNLGGWFIGRPDAAGAALGELIGGVLSGTIVTPPIQTLPLTEATQAHRLLESRQSIGKLILKPWL
jgi:NADPH:quinone reductase